MTTPADDRPTTIPVGRLRELLDAERALLALTADRDRLLCALTGLRDSTASTAPAAWEAAHAAIAASDPDGRSRPSRTSASRRRDAR